MLYDLRVEDGTAPELRSSTLELLAHIDRGEVVTIAVGGQDMSVHPPAGKRPRFMARESFVRGVLTHRADPGLRDDLVDLGLGSTTDDPRFP